MNNHSNYVSNFFKRPTLIKTEEFPNTNYQPTIMDAPKKNYPQEEIPNKKLVFFSNVKVIKPKPMKKAVRIKRQLIFPQEFIEEERRKSLYNMHFPLPIEEEE